ncbi:precorrin 3B synthase CobZ [Apiospora kogelbergensis]|uniref:precorrin 3B synthase CobZ n=1 Tax=Apiospora kogelbergensis TaxID=1337665 RepID=UPI00312E3465
MSQQHLPSNCDVVVIGSGNAGFSAAMTARQNGAKNVVLVDKCPEGWAGGNSYFTAGAFRTVHAGLQDLQPLVNNIDANTAGIIDLDPYTHDDFQNDLMRVTAGRSDVELARILIQDSKDAIRWLAGQGVRFQLSFNRQAYKANGRYKFWGGLALKTEDGGKGLIEDLIRAAHKHGVKIFWSATAKSLLSDPETGAVRGVVVEQNGKQHVVEAKAIILAAGGFEANPRLRSAYLGNNWDLAYVRGTPYNTGDCLEMAIRDVSAKQAGNWSGCHAVAWDANAAPNTGNRDISNQFTKSGYPLGIMVNNRGERFVDEGVDLRNFTYATFGKAILAQPDGMAFQIWDTKTIPWLRSEEYRDSIAHKIHANSIIELADKCVAEGLQCRQQFIDTLTEFNQSAHAHRRENPALTWDPAILDGVSTQAKAHSLRLPKTNWALPIDEAPFLAVKVVCGITFTFGGLAVNPETAAVISTNNGEIPGLFCAGEMVGGLFYGNYPGGSGLTSGAVFGRRAGRAAADLVASTSTP